MRGFGEFFFYFYFLTYNIFYLTNCKIKKNVDAERLRIIVKTGELVKPQNLYILAKGPSGETLLFKDLKSCGDWFKVSSYVIKYALDKEQTILGTNGINYNLFRKSFYASRHGLRPSLIGAPHLSKKKIEGVNSGITNSHCNMLVSSVGWPLESLPYIFIGLVFWIFFILFFYQLLAQLVVVFYTVCCIPY